MSIEETREDSDLGAGIRDSRNAEPRPEVADSGAGNTEAQASRHVESPWTNLLEARWYRYLVPTVCRTFAAAQLPGKLCAASTSIESASKLCDRISGKGGRVRG